MSDQMADPTNQSIQGELGELHRWVELPSTPDLAASVSSRLRTERRPRLSVLHGDRRAVLAAAAVILLAIAATTAFSGTVRDAVADALGIPGIRIEFDDDEPTVTPSIAPPDLGLGEQVSLTAANANVDFVIAAPDSDVYGLPDTTYLRQLPDGKDLVSLVYFPDDHFPETAETGLGLLLMEFKVDVGVEYMVKSIRGDGLIQDVRVGNSFGYWVEGSTELMIAGTSSSARPSGNVLIWQMNGVTYRMETALPMNEAIAIAEEISVIHSTLLTPTTEP